MVQYLNKVTKYKVTGVLEGRKERIKQKISLKN